MRYSENLLRAALSGVRFTPGRALVVLVDTPGGPVDGVVAGIGSFLIVHTITGRVREDITPSAVLDVDVILDENGPMLPIRSNPGEDPRYGMDHHHRHPICDHIERCPFPAMGKDCQAADMFGTCAACRG